MRSPSIVVLLALAACGGGGGGGSKPISQNPNPPPIAGGSLYPISVGSAWSYKITDPVKGVFDKFVEVRDAEPVPDTGVAAILVRDVEPTQEEWAWMVDVDGLVWRLREEDRRAGITVRATTWTQPGAPKNLSRAQPAGWKQRIDTSEVETKAGVSKTIGKTYEWQIIGEHQTVTVPAGTFDALVVARQRVDQPDEPVRTYWLVPGIGKVKEDSRERLEELSGYDVK